MLELLHEDPKTDQAFWNGIDNSNESSLDNYPVGPIVRFQPQKKHEDLILYNPDISILMLNIEYAERLTRRDETARSYFGSQKEVILTSTISDEKLELWDIKREINLASKFEPDFYIPCDYPVYMSDSPKKRIDFIVGYIRELEFFKNNIKNLPTSIIPLVKGCSKKERRICYKCFKKLGLNYVAYYCSQYFGGRVGNGFKDLLETIHNIAAEVNPAGILLIGLLSKRLLRQFPPQVVAAAGQRWIRKSGLRNDTSKEEARQNLAGWLREVEEALASGQMNLRMYN